MTVTDGRRQTHVNEQFFFVHFRLRPKNAIPGVGYFAYCEDTEGNVFGVMQNDTKAK